MNEIRKPIGETPIQSEKIPDVNAALRLKIKERREAKNLTLKELELASQVSAAEICKIEGGKRKQIPASTLKKLSPHLGVSLDYLLMLAVPQSISDHERFYDYNGNELDLFKISKQLYNLDTELFILLSEIELLQDKNNRDILKNYLKIIKAENSISQSESPITPVKQTFLNLFNDFKNYCAKLFSNLLILSNSL